MCPVTCHTMESDVMAVLNVLSGPLNGSLLLSRFQSVFCRLFLNAFWLFPYICINTLTYISYPPTS